MPREPKEENLRLRSLLDEAAMSNKGLARRVVDLAATRGLTGVRCDHTSVLRWLAGEQPRPPVPELAAEVLGNALGRKVSETELGMTPSNLPGDLGLQLPTGWTETIATSTALWRADVQRRRFLVNAVFTSAALPASALRWLTSPPAAAPSASGTRKVGRADIDAIRELTHSYREMDNRLGGGKLRSSVVSYLDDHVSRLLTDRQLPGRDRPAARRRVRGAVPAGRLGRLRQRRARPGPAVPHPGPGLRAARRRPCARGRDPRRPGAPGALPGPAG